MLKGLWQAGREQASSTACSHERFPNNVEGCLPGDQESRALPNRGRLPPRSPHAVTNNPENDGCINAVLLV